MSIHSDRPASAQTPYPEVWGLEALMDIGGLAAYLGVLVATIYDWRVHAKGPTAFRFGKHLRFAVSDVRAWVAAQREPSGQAGGTDGR